MRTVLHDRFGEKVRIVTMGEPVSWFRVRLRPRAGAARRFRHGHGSLAASYWRPWKSVSSIAVRAVID